MQNDGQGICRVKKLKHIGVVEWKLLTKLNSKLRSVSNVVGALRKHVLDGRQHKKLVSCAVSTLQHCKR